MGKWAGHGWSVEVDGQCVRVAGPKTSFDLAADETGQAALRRGLFGWRLTRPGRPAERLRRMSRPVATQVRAALARAAVDREWQGWVGRYEDLHAACRRGLEDGRWVPWDERDAFLDGRQPDLPARIHRAGAARTLSIAETDVLAFGPDEMASLVDATNDRILADELTARREFLASIESQPLTEEQARAVVTFDNRLQVLAAAGSGKTSVMVARAAYAVARGFVRPERVLLLAFNKKAADELQGRIEARFAAAGLSWEGVRASTFHSFGLSVIGAATGRKPSVAPWVADGRDSEKISEIVDRLRDSSKTFRYQWDLYRLVFARAPIEPDGGRPDAYDNDRREAGFETLHGDVVRSEGERMIADWLFINGVEYEYERPYEVEVADATHRQYTPDFYYPEIDAWHEHWALGRNGKPPPAFDGYEESMRWKRRLHAGHGTDLIETTFAEIVLGDGGFAGLEEALTSRGVALDWNPDRVTQKQPVSHAQMVSLLRTFLSHVKSSQATRESLRDLLEASRSSLAGARTRLFVDVFWPVFDAWNEELRVGGFVDFDDMLEIAAEQISEGFDPGYELVLVDEFQDSSRARARIVEQLVAPRGRFLMTVGDDWQSINRFAGADLAVMTDFHDRFGGGPQLALTGTFRCSGVICDVASKFVSKNRRQFDKAMRPVGRSDPGRPLEVVFADEPGKAVAAFLERLSKEVGPGGATVFVLGRYGFERREALPARTPDNLRVEFLTVHSSKGSEADYVVLPGMNAGTYGFPSTIADDPVLDLVMAAPDTFEHAEERRLLYVALTRARRGAHLIAAPSRPSAFVTELQALGRSEGGDPLVVQVDITGKPIARGQQVKPCPGCNSGSLMQRKGKFGLFLGCSGFPACTFTQNLDEGPVSRRSAVGPPCPRCKSGRLTRKKGKYGEFLGCSGFPACKYSRGA